MVPPAVVRSNDLPRPILFFVAAKENSSACSGSRQRPSASDSNLRCRKKEWPACSSRRDSDLPHPILIFVAAKKNGSACSGRSSSDEVRIRFYSPLPRRRMVSPADRHFPTAASILDFRLRLENQCSTIVAAAKNSPPVAQSWGAGRGRMPRRRHNPE